MCLRLDRLTRVAEYDAANLLAAKSPIETDGFDCVAVFGDLFLARHLKEACLSQVAQRRLKCGIVTAKPGSEQLGCLNLEKLAAAFRSVARNDFGPE